MSRKLRLRNVSDEEEDEKIKELASSKTYLGEVGISGDTDTAYPQVFLLAQLDRTLVETVAFISIKGSSF